MLRGQLTDKPAGGGCKKTRQGSKPACSKKPRGYAAALVGHCAMISHRIFP